MGSKVSRQQFLAAAAANGNAETFFQAVSADKANPNWIQYNSAVCISNTDSLASLYQVLFGLDDMDMIEFFQQAAKLPGGNKSCN